MGLSLGPTEPDGQDLSELPAFSIGYMRDEARRRRFLAYFNTALGGDRQRLIARTGYTKGRISQLFDKDQPFGEKAAASVASRLGLPEDYFEQPLAAKATEPQPATDTGWPFQLFSRTVWEALTERQRGAVEAMALQMIRSFWSAPPTPPPGAEAGRPPKVTDTLPGTSHDTPPPAGAMDMPPGGMGAPEPHRQTKAEFAKIQAHWVEQQAQWSNWADAHKAAVTVRSAPPTRPHKDDDH